MTCRAIKKIFRHTYAEHTFNHKKFDIEEFITLVLSKRDDSLIFWKLIIEKQIFYDYNFHGINRSSWGKL